MMIDASKPKILERPGAQRFEHSLFSSGRSELSPRDLFEKRVQFSRIHGDRTFVDAVQNPAVI